MPQNADNDFVPLELVDADFVTDDELATAIADFATDAELASEVAALEAEIAAIPGGSGGGLGVNAADHGFLPAASAAANTTALNEAIEAAGTGAVNVPDGIYTTNPVTAGVFNVGGGIRIVGESRDGVVIKCPTGMGACRFFELTDGRVEFHNFTIQGPDTFTTDDDVSGIAFDNGAGIYLYCNNMRFYRLNVGARGYGAVAQTMEFDFCEFDGGNIGLDGGADEQHSVFGILTGHVGGGVKGQGNVFKRLGSNTAEGTNSSHCIYLQEETPLRLTDCDFFDHIDGRYIQVFGTNAAAAGDAWQLDRCTFGPEQVPNIGVQTSPQIRAVLNNCVFDCDRVSFNPRGPALLNACKFRGGISNAWYAIDVADNDVTLDITGGTEFKGSVANDIFIQANNCELNLGDVKFRGGVNDTHIQYNSGVTGTKIRAASGTLFDMATAVTAIGFGGGSSTVPVLRVEGAEFQGDYRAITIPASCTVTDMSLQAGFYASTLTPLTNSGTITNLYSKGNIGFPDVHPIPSVTAAATIAIPLTSNQNVLITGNTNITSVTATYPGHRVTLRFSGTPTFTDGSNLKLSANLVATADDTITIICDGTNWYETARSVN